MLGVGLHMPLLLRKACFVGFGWRDSEDCACQSSKGVRPHEHLQAEQRGLADLCHTGSEVTSDEELVPFKLSLNNDESKVGLGVHVTRHVLNLFDLSLDIGIYALKQPIRGPSRVGVRFDGSRVRVQTGCDDSLEQLRG